MYLSSYLSYCILMLFSSRSLEVKDNSLREIKQEWSEEFDTGFPKEDYKFNDLSLTAGEEVEQFNLSHKRFKVGHGHAKLGHTSFKPFNNSHVANEDMEYEGLQDIVTEYRVESLSINSNKIKQGKLKDDISEYDYGELLKEYYGETLQDIKLNTTLNVTGRGKPIPDVLEEAKMLVDFSLDSKNCTIEETKTLGLKSMKCLLKDYRDGSLPLNKLISNLWTLSKIWLLVYIAIAIPCWCSRGYCCCCCFCRFCNPYKTINEAKAYWATNPPGVLKESPSYETRYEPTEYEMRCYEIFEHYVKTI